MVQLLAFLRHTPPIVPQPSPQYTCSTSGRLVSLSRISTLHSLLSSLTPLVSHHMPPIVPHTSPDSSHRLHYVACFYPSLLSPPPLLITLLFPSRLSLHIHCTTLSCCRVPLSRNSLTATAYTHLVCAQYMNGGAQTGTLGIPSLPLRFPLSPPDTLYTHLLFIMGRVGRVGRVLRTMCNLSKYHNRLHQCQELRQASPMYFSIPMLLHTAPKCLQVCIERLSPDPPQSW